MFDLHMNMSLGSRIDVDSLASIPPAGPILKSEGFPRGDYCASLNLKWILGIMQVSGSSAHHHGPFNGKRASNSTRNMVSLYREEPKMEITLDEFEEYALERLSLLRGIEQKKAQGFEKKELKEKINLLENKHMPLKFTTTSGTEEVTLTLTLALTLTLTLTPTPTPTAQDKMKQYDQLRKADVVSHFILRLAYCRTEDLRRW